MTSETQSNTNVGSVEAARPDTKLLCAVHDFLDRVEEVPPNELLGLILEALVVRMADQRATDEAIFAAEQEGASIDEAFDMFYLGDCRNGSCLPFTECSTGRTSKSSWRGSPAPSTAC
jgi:hypothetical protein